MTSLVAWIGVDQRGPASIYIASDSRLSWSDRPPWNRCRKIYASRRRPELIAYYGTVELPALLLGQLMGLRDVLLPSLITDARVTWTDCHTAIRAAVADYPVKHRFSVLYCARESERMNSRFRAFRFDCDMGAMSDTELQLPEKSGAIVCLGSGGAAVEKWMHRWEKTSQGGTSRSVFSAFCDSLASGDDPRTGGGPQLAGVYRLGSANDIGVVYHKKPYLMGIPLDKGIPTVEWRNSLFERCDSETLEKLPEAQQHWRPKGLGQD